MNRVVVTVMSALLLAACAAETQTASETAAFVPESTSPTEPEPRASTTITKELETTTVPPSPPDTEIEVTTETESERIRRILDEYYEENGYPDEELPVSELAGDGEPQVVFRFWTYLADDSFNISLQSDGTVVLVGGTSIYDGAESYSTWKLTEEGTRLLIDDVYRHTGGSVNTRGVALQMDRRYFPNSVEVKSDLSIDELVSRMRDQSWLKSEFETQPGPWTPDVLTFLVGESSGLSNYPYEWPLEESIESLIDPSLHFPQDAYDRQVMCLSGPDAAAAWTLIRDNENHAYITVVDNGREWGLAYSIAFPGYHISGNPCVT